MSNEIYVEVLSHGQTMRGMLHRPPEFSAARRYPALMMWHGFTSTRGESHRLFVQAAREFARSGIVVARFDFIGSGESDGDFLEVTPETEIADAQIVLSWMQAQAGIDRTRLGLLGLSMGGFVAACTAARCENVRALVLWAATSNMGLRIEERTTTEGWQMLEKLGYFDYGGFRISREFVGSARRVQPLNELSKYFGRALIVHGSGDAVVPPVEAHEYAAALKQCAPTLHIMTDADHSFARIKWTQELIDNTAAWLRENL